MPSCKQQIRFCTGHEGVSLAYAKSGNGTPIVKVANWLSHLESDWDSPVWGHTINALSQHHTLLRYDERGCGLSDWHVDDLSFASRLGDLEAVIDAAAVDRFVLFGSYQGAAIAVAYAARHPGRVSHLILHGGYARGRMQRANTLALREEAETMNKLAELGWGQQNPAFRQFFTTQFIPDGTPGQHQWLNELGRIATSPANAARFMRSFNDIDITHLLPKVVCPTLVMHSTRDARVPFAEGRLMAGLIPDARFMPIESNNHFLLENESGWQRWQDELLAFLPTTTAPDPAFATLTPRERELTELIAQGRDNAQAAAVFAVREKTVRNCITSIFAKLEVQTRAQAIVLARQAGFGQATMR